MTDKRRPIENRTITWQETCDVPIGWHPCANCGKEHAEPPHNVLLDFAKEANHRAPDGKLYTSTLWPGSHPYENWMPAGWSWDHEHGLICDECTTAVKAALAARKKA